jgi:superfamily II DNA helicase RecQ
MQKYLLSSHCREQFILNYFGQEIEKCGKCDFCKNLKNVAISIDELKNILLNQLHEKSISLDEILMINDTIHAENIKNALNSLILQELIIFENGKYLIN